MSNEYNYCFHIRICFIQLKMEERLREECLSQDAELDAHKRHQRELAEQLEEQRAIEAVRLDEEAARDQCAARSYARA